MKKKPGPKPRSDESSSKLIAIRMTDSEHLAFERAAKLDDMPLSVWFRWLAERRAKLLKRK